MELLDIINKDALRQAGFIHVDDTDAVMQAAFGTIPQIIDRRMAVPDIARWLGVSLSRLHRYIDDHQRVGVYILDKDSMLSLRQLMKIDWSALTRQKRTVGVNVGSFQSKKRKRHGQKD